MAGDRLASSPVSFPFFSVLSNCCPPSLPRRPSSAVLTHLHPNYRRDKHIELVQLPPDLDQPTNPPDIAQQTISSDPANLRRLVQMMAGRQKELVTGIEKD